jgi:methylmalonyl-CoA mutase C-terminal domain/subunit
MQRLKQRQLSHVRVIVGGIIPPADIPKLEALGVARVFTPGAPLTEIAEFVATLGASHE